MRLGFLCKCEDSVQTARVLEPLQRIGNGPPSHARLSRGIEHCSCKLIERLHPHERVDTQAEDPGRRIALGFGILSWYLREATRLDDLGNHLTDGLSGRCVTNESQRLGRAASDNQG